MLSHVTANYNVFSLSLLLENLEVYLQSVKVNPDPELSKKTFEKKNCKSNANIGQLQKKLDKYQKAQKVRRIYRSGKGKDGKGRREEGKGRGGEKRGREEEGKRRGREGKGRE